MDDVIEIELTPRQIEIINRKTPNKINGFRIHKNQLKEGANKLYIGNKLYKRLQKPRNNGIVIKVSPQFIKHNLDMGFLQQINQSKSKFLSLDEVVVSVEPEKTLKFLI